MEKDINNKQSALMHDRFKLHDKVRIYESPEEVGSGAYRKGEIIGMHDYFDGDLGESHIEVILEEDTSYTLSIFDMGIVVGEKELSKEPEVPMSRFEIMDL